MWFPFDDVQLTFGKATTGSMAGRFEIDEHGNVVAIELEQWGTTNGFIALDPSSQIYGLIWPDAQRFADTCEDVPRYLAMFQGEEERDQIARQERHSIRELM